MTNQPITAPDREDAQSSYESSLRLQAKYAVVAMNAQVLARKLTTRNLSTADGAVIEHFYEATSRALILSSPATETARDQIVAGVVTSPCMERVDRTMSFRSKAAMTEEARDALINVAFLVDAFPAFVAEVDKLDFDRRDHAAMLDGYTGEVHRRGPNALAPIAQAAVVSALVDARRVAVTAGAELNVVA